MLTHCALLDNKLVGVASPVCEPLGGVVDGLVPLPECIILLLKDTIILRMW